MQVSPSLPVVRVAEEQDAPSIAAVHVETWRDAYRGIVDQGHLDGLRDEDYEQRWTRILSAPAPSRRHWVAELDDEVVGFASAGRARDEDVAGGELYALYVLPSAWGRGTGQKLLQVAFAFLAESGHSVVILWVLADNPRARRFYEAAGMVLDGAEGEPSASPSCRWVAGT